MRLVTWSVDHGSGGRHRQDDFLTALEALGPDILVLVNRGTGALLKPLREAVAGIGLVHQLAPDAATPHRPLLIASRLELVRGSLPRGGDAASAPPNALHVYAPGGIVDVLSLKVAHQGQRPASGHNGWRWLLDPAARLKHRRSILIGDFAASAAGDETGGHQATFATRWFSLRL